MYNRAKDALHDRITRPYPATGRSALRTTASLFGHGENVIGNASQLSNQQNRHYQAVETSFVHFVEARTLQISAISFDGDMTLWDFQKVMRHSLKHTLVELRRHVPTQRAKDLTVEEMIAIRNRVAEKSKGKLWNLEEIRRLAFEKTLERIACQDRSLAVHLNEIYLKHRFEDIELYWDVVPTLDILVPHFTVGLLSNGNSYPERCGLEGRFAFVVLSQDVRVEKPDRRIFQIAARKACCPLEQLLHVGDSLENDVVGAREAGAHAVWLNREGLGNDTEIKADYEITSLTDLPIILGVGGS